MASTLADLNRDLVRRHQDGDPRAAEELLRLNSGLVHRVVNALFRPWMRLEPADLEQAGRLALLHAASRFDLERDIRFSTYASWWIRQGVQRAIAWEGRIVRLPVHADASEGIEPLSLDQSLTDGDAQLLDILADPVNVERQAVAAAVVAQLLSVLTERERNVVQRRYGIGRDPETLQQVGDELHVSREAARLIEVRALRKLRAAAAP